MAFRWKLYSWCCWYQLLYNIGFVILLIYLVFISGEVSSNGYASGALLIGFIIAAGSKPLVSLKFLKHLKNKTVYTDGELVLFITGFCLSILVLLLVGYLFLFQLAAYTEVTDTPLLSTLQLLPTILFFVASLYLLVFDIPLKIAVRKQSMVQ